jgi:hypothetical protein
MAWHGTGWHAPAHFSVFRMPPGRKWASSGTGFCTSAASVVALLKLLLLLAAMLKALGVGPLAGLETWRQVCLSQACASGLMQEQNLSN